MQIGTDNKPERRGGPFAARSSGRGSMIIALGLWAELGQHVVETAARIGVPGAKLLRIDALLVRRDGDERRLAARAERRTRTGAICRSIVAIVGSAHKQRAAKIWQEVHSGRWRTVIEK